MANAVLLLAFAVWFASPNGTAKVEHQSAIFVSPTDKEDEETFRKLYEEMKQTILKDDKAAFEKFFAGDYMAISSRGTTLTRQQVVDAHTQKPTADTRIEAVNFSGLKARVWGDTAILTYLAEMSGINKGNKFSQRARITNFWEKKDGKWVSVASHASAVQ